MAKEKSRNFTFLLYPDSVPEDWKTKLSEMDLPIAISPLHDKDDKEFDVINDELPTPEEKAILKAGGHVYKKAHWHVIYIANNPVTTDAVRNKLKRVLGDKSVSAVRIVNGLRSMYAYLTHSTPDAIKKKKYRYDENDITLLNNFDIDRYATIDDVQKREMMDVVLKIVRENQLENIIDLNDFIDAHGKEYGFNDMSGVNSVIASRTGLLRMYFDGNYQRRKSGYQVLNDPQKIATREAKAEEKFKHKEKRSLEVQARDMGFPFDGNAFDLGYDGEVLEIPKKMNEVEADEYKQSYEIGQRIKKSWLDKKNSEHVESKMDSNGQNLPEISEESTIDW